MPQSDPVESHPVGANPVGANPVWADDGEPVLFHARADGIAIITINRPSRHNALDAEARHALTHAWRHFESDPALRIAILTGAGDQAFCAGSDLVEMAETGMRVPPRDFLPIPYDNIDLTKPTIAAVNGLAFADGWLIAQACDLCVAATTATFAIPEVRVGRGSHWATPLIHMIPQRIMMEIILTGKPIPAQRAYDIGLVNRLAAPASLIDTAIALAQEVLEGAPLSVKAGREAVMLATEMGRSAALIAARAAYEIPYRSADAQEGPRAFAEKRQPEWQGR